MNKKEFQETAVSAKHNQQVIFWKSISEKKVGLNQQN